MTSPAVFADTSYYLAALRADDPAHAHAIAESRVPRQIVTTEFGCKDTLATTVEVKPHYTFYIPSAFTPNDNGINEVWAPHGENVMLYELRIFNRWNQQIFQSSDMETGWDGTFNGTLVPQGVYTYQIELYDTLGEPHEYVGRFTVMR